jgi:hypothetical protein
LIDKIPLLETKEMSTITAAGEFAYLVPGHSKALVKTVIHTSMILKEVNQP